MEFVNNILSNPTFISMKANLTKAMAPLQNKVAAVALAIFAFSFIIAKHFFFKAEKSEIKNLTDTKGKQTDQLISDGKKLKGLTIDRPRIKINRALPARKPRQRPTAGF